MNATPRRPSVVRRLAAACGLAAAALASPACQSDGGDGGGAAARGSNDAPGAVLADVVRIAKIDRSTVNQDGRVRYYVDNVSGADQEDLSWSVSFAFPNKPTGALDEIAVSSVEETTAEKSLVLLRGEQGKMLEAACGAFAEYRARGDQVLGTRLNVAQNPPVLTVPRKTDGTPGTRFLNGRIECVAQSDIYTDPSKLTIEFENVSSQKVVDLEVQVVFIDTRARSKWRPIPAMEAGRRGAVTLDLSGLDLGSRDFLVKVRQAAL